MPKQPNDFTQVNINGSEPMSQRSSVLARSCFECRRRKIKCDRSLRCSYCVKVGAQCSYPLTSAASHETDNKVTDGDLVRRDEKSEQTLSVFEHGLARLSDRLDAKTSSSVPVRSAGQDLVQQHHEISCRDSETEKSLSYLNEGNGLRGLFNTPLASALEYLRPPTAQLPFIWQKYLENVDPLIKIMHAPTVQKKIMSISRGRGILSPPNECMVFAIYYATVVTMTEAECQAEFNDCKIEVLKRYSYPNPYG
jgi:hypothetical protein